MLSPFVATKGAFGFVDPDNVLHASHIIPVFSSGKFQDEFGISQCVDDSHNRSRYYVNWWVKVKFELLSRVIDLLPSSFIDQDMIMRYYWGLAISHTYAHIQQASASHPPPLTEAQNQKHDG